MSDICGVCDGDGFTDESAECPQCLGGGVVETEPLVMTESGNDRAISEGRAPTLRSNAHRAPTLLRMREGKPGGGKGPLISEDVSLTLSQANDQTVFAPMSVRRLTPTETERLQAFPDGWSCLEVDDDGTGTFRFPDGEPYSTERCACPDGPRYAAMGNAVTVSMVARVLALVDAEMRVIAALEGAS